MHFPIIELTPHKGERTSRNIIGESPTIRANTDYLGDSYNVEERQRLINGPYLRETLNGVATINPEDESVTFLSESEIRDTLKQEYRNIMDRLNYRLENGKLSIWDFREASENFRDSDFLFYVDGCGQTSMRFADVAPYYAGKTYYFGNIIDAHL